MATSAFLIALIVACAVSKVYCIEESDTAERNCTKESAAAKGLVNIFKGKAGIRKTMEEIYCHQKCVFEKENLIDEEGVLQIEEYKKLFPFADEECLKSIPRIEECTDMKYFDTLCVL